MKTTLMRLLLVLPLLCLVGCVGTASPERHRGLLGIKDDVLNQRVSFLKVKRVNYSVFTGRAASPESFETMEGKTIMLQVDERVQRDLLRAIEKSKTAGPNEAWRPDIRLGIYFKDANGKVIHTVFADARYLNAINRKALIDGACWKLRGGLIKFAEKAICTEGGN